MKMIQRIFLNGALAVAIALTLVVCYAGEDTISQTEKTEKPWAASHAGKKDCFPQSELQTRKPMK
jgi:uncharacterized membrane protein